jgi:DNA-binding NtrC family response regulator
MEISVPRGHILLVDDEPSLLRMMSTYLQRLGYSVTTCATTDRACAEIQAHPEGFDAAVLDATMDGLTMEELALLMLRANPAMRILGASGYPVDMSALEAAAPRRVAFLHKPFTPQMLAASLGRMLAAEKEEGL